MIDIGILLDQANQAKLLAALEWISEQIPLANSQGT